MRYVNEANYIIVEGPGLQDWEYTIQGPPSPRRTDHSKWALHNICQWFVDKEEVATLSPQVLQQEWLRECVKEGKLLWSAHKFGGWLVTVVQ